MSKDGATCNWQVLEEFPPKHLLLRWYTDSTSLSLVFDLSCFVELNSPWVDSRFEARREARKPEFEIYILNIEQNSYAKENVSSHDHQGALGLRLSTLEKDRKEEKRKRK